MRLPKVVVARRAFYECDVCLLVNIGLWKQRRGEAKVVDGRSKQGTALDIVLTDIDIDIDIDID